MAKMVRFLNIEIPAGGGDTEVLNIIGSMKHLHTGEVQQITIRKVDSEGGGDPVIDIQIRYISNNSYIDKLVYLYDDATVTDVGFVDSSIDAPFSCATKGVDGDLHFYINSDIGCELNVRIDFDINNVKGF